MKRYHKKKFKPTISRIELSPEQAVLTCCDNVTKNEINIADDEQCSSSEAHCTPPGANASGLSS